MHDRSYENELNLHLNEISFSYERMGTKTRFEKEANGTCNSEMAYSQVDPENSTLKFVSIPLHVIVTYWLIYSLVRPC